MRVVLAGLGAVGRHAKANLEQRSEVEAVTVVEGRPANGRNFPTELPPADVVLITVPRDVTRLARAALARKAHVVACTDDPVEVRALLGLDAAAVAVDRTIVVGAAMSPGLSCVLAHHAAERLASVDEVHVASLGTGGPACARQHHESFSLVALDWHDGMWRRRPGGSGRELVWFPEPVGGADCYRAGLVDARLLVPAFPSVRRVTARRHATRQDRLTSALPMLRRPHPEGLVGAVRAEVRGWSAGVAQTVIVGAVVPPAAAAGAVMAVAAAWAVQGRMRRAGAGGLAEVAPQPGAFLTEMAALGITPSVFVGADAPSS